MFIVRKSSYFQCFNSILSCPSAKFNLGLLICIDVGQFCYTVHVLFFIGSRTTILYTTISLCVYAFICVGHHDSDRMAVLVSQVESVVL